jgi:hypothetical protein
VAKVVNSRYTLRPVVAAAQQPHGAIREINKVHAPNLPTSFSISCHAPQGRRAVADAGSSATLVHGF